MLASPNMLTEDTAGEQTALGWVIAAEWVCRKLGCIVTSISSSRPRADPRHIWLGKQIQGRRLLLEVVQNLEIADCSECFKFATTSTTDARLLGAGSSQLFTAHCVGAWA